jgi:translation initiation factor 1 (eIF-1/SUI1)
MERYTRLHFENGKTISLEIVGTDHDWEIKLSSQEGGKGLTRVGFHADSLEKAKELANALVARRHACGSRCSEWVTVQSAGRA